ncbi:PIF1 family DEAD/DEAH box helicase [Corynebacterium lubricantis]|uniref:PIF1 family DEAD/DEAH box helicase n=1 Tax=Corynebacterium lubricantis TaxID=541095 RepID=UPI001FE0387B|nr:PIF1 family DEAD/DEAH box helicase [Corynebacterium lubricantis]
MTEEFSRGLDLISQGHHVLITGKAGTGKSTLLRTFLEQGSTKEILVTAPTGVAALNIDGFTIHRTFGFRPGMWPDDLESGEWHPSSTVRDVLKAVDILVVDEISMVRADLFDMMDIALRTLRKNDLPFGGVQLVLVGDLLQLPPVVEDNEREIFTSRWKTPFFFSANCFDSLNLKNINLTKVWRQSDNEFIEILNQVREGSVGDAALEVLNDHVDADFHAPDDWVTLASRRKTVEKINAEHLAALPAQHLVSIAEHTGNTNGGSFSGTEELHYAKGARVMTIINDSLGRFVNGSFGIVTEADNETISVRLDHSGETVELGKHTWEIKQPSVSGGSISSNVVGTIEQFPVNLAWAITIHKSQGKTIPKCYINLHGGTTTDGQFYVALSRAVDLELLRFSAPVEPRHIRANNSLVRMIRREVSPQVTTNRVVFLSFDGVNFGISDHIARAHAIIMEGQTIVANFGTWINPMADLGEFGKKNNIPAGGLALAPTLGDFWPLLLRQAEDGIVVADGLPMLERAVRHQERGLDLALGVGYDIDELNVVLTSTGVEDRCLEMAASYQLGTFKVGQGDPVPTADLEAEGSVYIPSWAPTSNMVLDPARATESDRAWAAFSGGETNDLDFEELSETAELLSAWAVSRSYWNEQTYREVEERANNAGLYYLDLPEVQDNNVDLNELFSPGTRVAFTGRDNLLGGPADDERLTEICEARGLEYKTGVSKSRCDVLVALDPASMSRKAQNAREYGKPIVAQADFEQWYENGSATVQEPEPAPEPESVPEEPSVPEPTDTPLTSDPHKLLTAGTRIAFRGTTIVDGKRYAHGEQLQSLCEELNLDYKQAVSKTRCDVLVTDDLTSTDGKMMLAKRYDKPLITQEDFDLWATDRLAALGELDESEPQATPAWVPLETEDLDEPVAEETWEDATLHDDSPVHPEYWQEPQPTTFDSNPFNVSPTIEKPYEQPYVEPYVAPTNFAPPTNPVPAPLPEQPVEKEPNKSARRFKRSIIATVVLIVLTMAAALIDGTSGTNLETLGVLLILGWFVTSGMSVIFGIMAFVHWVKNR